MKIRYLLFIVLFFPSFKVDRKKKVVIAAYAKFSDFEACGKQEILLLSDSIYIYRLFLKKNVTVKKGTYKINDNQINFSPSRRLFYSLNYEKANNLNLTSSDSITFNGKIYFKTNNVGPPCFYTKDSVIYNLR